MGILKNDWRDLPCFMEEACIKSRGVWMFAIYAGNLTQSRRLTNVFLLFNILRKYHHPRNLGVILRMTFKLGQILIDYFFHTHKLKIG